MEQTTNLTETQLTKILEANADQIHKYYGVVLAEKERAIAEATLAYNNMSNMYNAAVDRINTLEDALSKETAGSKKVDEDAEEVIYPQLED